ncbi:MAG: TIGR03016 family PEP-CTERM system-associated outer membrane protein [Nitrospira sp.]|nr:TIGR03016 family PEP-CTERM system-associated outer membrane protein [Candidatus Brocadiales bacterium]MBL7048835.1 TIGR03016 family PEP-CTERM system-associated outer membrane protein [Nitrospira sp.]
MKRIIIPLVAVLGLLISTDMAFSQSKYKLLPSFSLKEEYNDNILLTLNDREDDFITEASPALKLEYHPNSVFDLDLMYRLEFEIYSQNSENNDETHYVNLKSQIRPFNRVFIDLSDSYNRVSVDARSASGIDNSLVNKTEKNVFSVTPYVQFPLGSPSLTATMGYGYKNIWYKSALGNDANSHELFATISKRFQSKTEASVTYNFLSYSTVAINEYDRHAISAAASYMAASNIKLWGTAGYSSIDFKTAASENKGSWQAGIDYDLQDTAISSGGSYSVSYVTSEADAVSYSSPSAEQFTENPARDFDTSTSIGTGLSERRVLNIYLNAGMKYKLRMNAYHTEEKEIKTSRSDRIQGVSLMVSSKLTPKVMVSVDTLFEDQRFEPEHDKVGRFSLGGNLNYRVSEKINASLGYRFNKRETDKNTDEYFNNIVSLFAQVNF